MRALIKTSPGQGHIELKEIPVPEVTHDQVLIKVKYAAVCGTDVHLQYDRFSNTPPFALGHEFSGMVEGIGPTVKNISVGDRVVSENNPFACRTCNICTSGHPNLCPQKRAMGIHSDGCFADYVKLPSHLLHVIPENVSLKEAALMEPLAVAVHSVANRCGIRPKDTVVVFGAGAIGLLAAQVAYAEGAQKVLLVGTNKDESVRFPCAREIGIETLNAQEENVVEKILFLTNAGGADVVVEASGSPAAIAQGLDLLKKAGRMAVSGITGLSEIKINWDKLVSKGISLYFCYSSVNADWEKGLHYLSEKKVRTLPLITHHFKLEEWKKALGVLENLEAIRPLFEMES